MYENQSISTLNLTNVRNIFNGQVITPNDAGYDEARTVFFGGIDRRPAVIIRPADAAGVAHVISLARDSGMELAIRSGGHSAAGHSLSEGGIVLDLKDMKALEINVARRTAWAETGLTAGEYTARVGAYDLATGFGDTGSVGIGGITLGGGVGYLVRKHGLTIDNLLGAEVVTADGQILQVNAESHPDLFWAIRGGGGNFGVATRFLYQLHEVRSVVGGMLILPATPETIASFIAIAQDAPEELSTIANVMSAPPMPFLPPEYHGKLILFAFLVYAGDDLETGERAILPFRKLATPIADMLKPIRYPEMFPAEQEDYHPTSVGRTMFLDKVDHAVAESIVEHLNASDAAMRVAQLRVLGGAMARVPVGATAFAHRQAPIMVNLAAFYNGAEDKARRESWVDDFAAAMSQGYSGVYVNFLSAEEGSRVRDAYPGAIWERLAAVKARYDPENLFKLNHNITPASKGDLANKV